MRSDQVVSSIRRRRSERSILWLGTSALAILATPALSQTVNVTNTSDTGAGSLRAGIEAANGDPAISIVHGTVPAGSVITLNSGPVDVTSTLTIDAENAFTISNIPNVPNQAALQLSGGNTLTIGAPVTVSTSFNQAPVPIPTVGGIRILDAGNLLDIYGKVETNGGRQVGISNLGNNNQIRVKSGASVSSRGSYTGAIASAGAGGSITLEAGAELIARSFYGRGISFSGAGTIVDIDGQLTTTGSASLGVWADADAEGAVINVSGLISTEYDGSATGVLVQAENGVVSVSETGEITTQDHEWSTAISFGANANNGSAIVAGRISAGSGKAIEFNGTNNRLELQAGYSITGSVTGAGSDRLIFGGTDNANFDLAGLGVQYTGFGAVQKTGASTWTLSGDGSTFAGPIAVLDGTLNVTGSLGGALTVQSGGALGGTGTLGAVTVADGGILEPGSSPGTLHMNSLLLNNGSVLNFELGTPGVAAASDRIDVMGNLTLDGILNVSDAGGFGNGVYTLIDYGNLVADNGLALGRTPTGYSYALDSGTGAASAVTLAVSGGAAGTNQYWDGANTVPGGTLYGRGGAGVWNAVNTNWTDLAGTANNAWGDQFAVFYNGTSDVTVDGIQSATGLQFASDGYRLVAGSGGSLNLTGTSGTVLVDAGATATLALPLTVTGDLAKQGAGTLNLAGDTTSGSTMQVTAGMLRVMNGAEVEAKAALANTGGHLEIEGPGSRLAITNAHGALGIGLSGVGNMSVINGGVVEVDTHGPTQIGRNAGGDGSLLISGPGSEMLLLDGGLELGSVNGTGEIEVTDGGLLRVDGYYEVVEIPGGGPLGEDITQFTLTDTLIVGKDGGTGTLKVTDGGRVEAGLVVMQQATEDSGYGPGTGTILVDGGGSSFTVEENLQVFNGGTITISGGAEFRTFTDSYFRDDPYRHIIAPDRISGGSGTAIVTVTGAGSLWHSGNSIQATDAVTLTVEESARVEAAGNIRIGFGRTVGLDAPSESLLVDNAALKAGQTLEIAQGGAWAKADFINGATIESNGVFIAGGATCAPGEDGTCGSGTYYFAKADILVSGVGTTWTDGEAYSFTLGDTGTATLTITDGAVVETENHAVFGWGSYDEGRADVVVSGGGRFSTASSLQLGSGFNGTGTLTVYGTGSVVEVGTTLDVGGEGKGSVTLRDNAVVTVANDTILGAQEGGQGRITVTGGAELFTDRIYMGITDGSATGILTIGEGSDYALVDARRLDLRSGELRLGANGILSTGTGPANIGARSLVSGTGSIFGDVVLDGRIAPGHSGIGTLSVEGDVTFNAGSVYAIDLQAPNVSDLIAIDGSAVVNGGAIEITKLSNDDSYLDGQTYTIVTAGAVDVQNEFTLGQPFGLLRTDVVYEADRIDLTLTADLPFTTLAQTFNQTQTALGLQDLAQAGDALAVYNTLVGLSLQPSGDDAVRRAFDLTSGEVHAAGQQVIDQTFALFNRTLRHQGVAGVGSGNVGAQTFTAPLGYGPAVVAGNAGVSAIGDATDYADASVRSAWAAPLGGFGQIDGDGNAAQLDYWNAGLAGGYEGVIDAASGRAVGGFGFGYIHSRGTIDDRLSTFDADGFYLGAYGAWTDGPWNVAGSLSYGANRVSTERNIAFMGRTAEADYWTHTIGLSSEASYAFDLADTTKFAPLLTLDASWSGNSGFTETGAGALNLTSGSQSWTRLDTGLGIALTHAILTENGTVTLEGRAVWEHAFSDVVPSQSLAIAGSPTSFTVLGPDAGRDRLRIGAGFSWDVSDEMTVRARYDGLFSNSQANHSASLGLNVRF